MSPETSSDSSAKRRSPRKWTDAKKAKVLAYYAQHGHGATIRKYKLSSGMLHFWRHAGGVGTHDRAPRAGNGASRGGVNMSSYVIAKRLKKAVRQRLVEGAEFEEVETLAMMLANEVLRG